MKELYCEKSGNDGKIIKKGLKNVKKGVVGGLIYNGLEMFWRGNTHYSMTIAGGISFLGIGFIDRHLKCKKMKKSAICALLITAIELVFGLIWNRDRKIWDYSDKPFNFKGYICLGYSMMWFLLSFPAMAIFKRWKD